eukprot:g1319.t1
MGNAADRAHAGAPDLQDGRGEKKMVLAGVGPMSPDELKAAKASLSFGEELMNELPQEREAYTQMRRLGVSAHAKSRGCLGICEALAREIRIESDFHDTQITAQSEGEVRVRPDHDLVESLCDLLRDTVQNLCNAEIEGYIGEELGKVSGLMNLAMDAARKARRKRRMELLGMSYEGHLFGSSEDTDSDIGSEDSMVEQDDDHVAPGSMPGANTTKPFKPGTSDEDHYVNPDESAFVDRGTQKACYASLRACCEFLSKLCQQGAQIQKAKLQDPIMSVHLKCVKSLLDKKDTAEAAAREYQEENMTLATAASQVREVGGAGFGGLY